MGVLMMLLTIGGLLAAGVLFAIAWLNESAWLKKFVFGGVAIWFAFYVVMLLGYSAASKDRVLGVGEPKEFCGFYLDCHMHAEVTNVQTANQIGNRTAKGKFYIVGLRVFSDAKNPNIAFRLIEPRALIEVDDHTAIVRDLESEALLPTAAVDLGGEMKGSQTIDLEPERALTAWLLTWGEAKTREFVQKLLANGTTVRRGHTLQAAPVR